MYNVDAPRFPDYSDNEDFHLSSIRLPAFAGMQIRNGRYGAISEPGESTGETHVVADKDLDPTEFRVAVSWVIDHDAEIRAILFSAMLVQYNQMRNLIVESLVEEEPDEVVPPVEKPSELAALCGLVSVHIDGMSADGEPRFGIELGCNWEEEHGAGIRFLGLRVVEVGDASYAFMFPNEEA